MESMNEMEEKTLNKASNGDDSANDDPEATETDAFTNNDGSNGRVGDHCRKEPKNMEGFGRIKDEMNKEVFWKIKVWMALIILVIIIVLVIFISIAVCSAMDEDENTYDRSLFIIPHYFNGSFQMSNFSSASTEKALREKLTDLYTASPALGRYFSEINLNFSRNDSVTYNVTFVLPENELEELKKFTLSREMVYNVLRQYLYEQDEKEVGMLFINPDSLEMS